MDNLGAYYGSTDQMDKSDSGYIVPPPYSALSPNGKPPQIDPDQNGNASIVPDGQNQTVRMKRQIGLFGGIAMIVGTTIGSGIFITPSPLLEKVNSVAVSLTVWAACGLLSTLAGLTYCELGTVVPRSGGEHAYFQAAYKPLHKFFGELPAFLFAWMTATLLKPSSLAVLSMSFGRYVMLPFIKSGDIDPDWEKGTEFQVAQKLLAVVCVFTVAFINIQSAKLSSRIQIVFTCAKLLAPAIVIVIGVYNLFDGQFGGIPDHYDSSDKGFGIAVAFYGGLWAYDGWNNLNFLTEELENPSRNLPLAVVFAMPLITLLYLLTNISYLTVLTKMEIINSDAVGIEFADRKLGSFSFILPVLIAMSIFGTANGSLYTAGRIAYVAGRDNHLIHVMSYVHATKLTPTVAILFNSGMSLILIAYSSVNSLIDTFGFASWIIYSLAFISLFILRYTRPELERPFRVPLFIPALALIFSVALVVLPIINEPSLDFLIPIGFWLVGIALYYPFVYKKYSLGFMGKVTRFIQCLTLSAPSPYKED